MQTIGIEFQYGGIVMVRFEDNKLIIEVQTFSRNEAVERWLDLHAGLCELLCFVRQDTICDKTFFAVPDFLQELMPDWDDASRLADKNK